MSVGPFEVTPRLNDHSAFDAYSLVIEADDRTILYTGDIRGHGRKRALFEALLADPPVGVDVMLMEGTHVRPDPTHDDEDFETEEDLELRLSEVLVEHSRTGGRGGLGAERGPAGDGVSGGEAFGPPARRRPLRRFGRGGDTFDDPAGWLPPPSRVRAATPARAGERQR